LGHLRRAAKHFQPSNAHFGLMPELPERVKRKERRERYAERARAAFAAWRSAQGRRTEAAESLDGNNLNLKD